MINNNNNNINKSEGGGMASMGVAWFVQDSSDQSSIIHRLNHNNNLKTNKDTKVDLIDIEDEDHSFAAFFIGMKTGPSPYVKRPLVLHSVWKLPKMSHFGIFQQFLSY